MIRTRIGYLSSYCDFLLHSDLDTWLCTEFCQHLLLVQQEEEEEGRRRRQRGPSGLNAMNIYEESRIQRQPPPPPPPPTNAKVFLGRDGVVGMVTRYGQDGLRTECRWLWDFPHTFRLYNGYWVSFPGVKRPGWDLDQPTASSAEDKESVEL